MADISSIKRERVSDLAAQEIRRYIVSNNLAVGDRLPTIRELSERLAVGQSSVREAVNRLAVLDIIDISPLGMTVKDPGVSPILERITFLYEAGSVGRETLVEARAALEEISLRHAVKRVTSEDLAILEDILADMERHAEEGEESTAKFAKDDLKFHEALMAIGKNRIIEEFGSVLKLFFYEFDSSGSSKDTQGQSDAETIEHHRAIVQALRQKDIDEALQVLHHHLTPYEDC